MADGLTTEQVIDVAVTAEKNAAAFYEKCAESYPDQRGVYESLTSCEKKHAELFEQMRPEGSGGGGDAQFGEDSVLAAMAEMTGIEGALPESILTEATTPLEVLAHAIDAEKSAVLLYVGLKDRVESDAISTLNTIIEDEMGHIAKLYQIVKQL